MPATTGGELDHTQGAWLALAGDQPPQLADTAAAETDLSDPLDVDRRFVGPDSPQAPADRLVVVDAPIAAAALEARVARFVTGGAASEECGEGVVDPAQRSAQWLVAVALDLGSQLTHLCQLCELVEEAHRVPLQPPGVAPFLESGVVALTHEAEQPVELAGLVPVRKESQLCHPDDGLVRPIDKKRGPTRSERLVVSEDHFDKYDERVFAFSTRSCRIAVAARRLAPSEGRVRRFIRAG